jgi:hypothetical protein
MANPINTDDLEALMAKAKIAPGTARKLRAANTADPEDEFGSAPGRGHGAPAQDESPVSTRF